MKTTIDNKNIGTLIISGLFIIAGIITIYDTQSYGDLDSMVFPRAAAIVLIICATISLLIGLLKPTEDEGFGTGIWWRRITLITTMLVCCFTMPYIGFLAAGVISFIGGLISAMHDNWSKRTMLIYGGSGALVMVGFYTLFRYALHVPLP